MHCAACKHDTTVESFWLHVGVLPPDGVPLCPKCPGCPSCRAPRKKTTPPPRSTQE